MKKFVTAVAAAAAVSLMGGFAQADVHEVNKSYVVPAGNLTVVCGTEGLPGIGGDCFGVVPGSNISVQVQDSLDNTTEVGFDVRFYGAAGRIGAPGGIHAGCNALTIPVPPGAELMRVFVGVQNGDCESPGVSVVGTIEVSPLAS